MSGCKDNIDRGCKKTSARCTIYEGDHSKCSELGECDSYSVHDTLGDISKQLDSLCDLLDVSEIQEDCIDVGEEKTVHSLLQGLVEAVCDLKERVGEEEECPTIFDKDITCVGLDYKCLVDPCGEQPSTLKELLQILINQNCEE